MPIYQSNEQILSKYHTIVLYNIGAHYTSIQGSGSGILYRDNGYNGCSRIILTMVVQLGHFGCDIELSKLNKSRKVRFTGTVRLACYM